MATHSPSQRYLSTRGGSYGFSFEDVVLKGLAQDGGLFIPEAIPSLPADWQTKWKDASFQELAFNIFSLYISPHEIASEDLRQIINKSYATFRVDNIAPNVTLDAKRNIHLLELFHGPVSGFLNQRRTKSDSVRHLHSKTSPYNFLETCLSSSS